MKRTILILIMMAGLQAQALTITNKAATSITTTSATFNATFAGVYAATGTVYYGTIDRTTNATLWAFSNVVGNVVDGDVGTNLTGLLPLHKYYFRYAATESNVVTWSAATSNFWTKPTSPTSTPAVVTISVQTDTNAVLKSPTNFFRANTNLMIDAGVGMASDLTAHESATGTNVHGLGTMSTVDDAPSDGSEYARKDGAWSAVVGATNASEINVTFTPTNYTAGATYVEQHLIGIDSALLSAGKTQAVEIAVALTPTNISPTAQNVEAFITAFDGQVTDQINTNTGLQADIDRRVLTNDTRQLDFTGADVRITDATETNQPVTKAQHDTKVSLLDSVRIYAGTNISFTTPDSTNLYINADTDVNPVQVGTLWRFSASTTNFYIEYYDGANWTNVTTFNP